MTEIYEHRLFINNEFVDTRSTETLTVRNPHDDSVVDTLVQVAGREDVDLAVAAAAEAFKTWRKTPDVERAKCMEKLADLIDANAAALGMLETVAIGQPISVSTFTTTMVSAWWRYYAGWTSKIAGESWPDSGDGVYRLVQYEPLGVCAGIAAWNATFFYTAWKMAPAVAAGNTFIFKASEKSPLGILLFAKLVKEAGFPPGVINIINGRGETGELLASHMSIAKISFTGSTSTGRKVQIAAASSNLKRCALELGGKSPAVVFADANMENALAHMSQTFFLNSGQVCAATSRLFIEESASAAFIEQLTQRFKAGKGSLGAPQEPTTMIGPVADREQYERIMGIVQEAKDGGLNIVVGGEAHQSTGFYIEPTLVIDPPTDSFIYQNEVFGPVLVVRTFTTEAEVIEVANDSIYGLGAAVFTKDIARALRVSGELQAGHVGINQPVFPDMHVPFGGTKQSGSGKEGGKEGIMSYLESKTISINMKSKKHFPTSLPFPSMFTVRPRNLLFLLFKSFYKFTSMS